MPSPLHPSISGNVTAVSNTPSTFRSGLNTNIGAVEDKAQLTQELVEQLQVALGHGWLSGGTISVKAGQLAVDVSAYSALVGSYVTAGTITVVGSLTASSTNYLFLRQDGTWTVNTTGSNPADTATHGYYLLWGTAVTDGSEATSVTNVRKKFYGTAGLYQAVTITTSPYTATYQRVILADTTSGNITINLPAAATETLPYRIKKLVAGNTLTIDANASETIDGSTTLALSGAADAVEIISDGANWQVMSSHSL